MAGLFPEGVLTAADAALDTFEDQLAGLDDAGGEQVFAVVERVVLALNAVDEALNRCTFETDEREELCDHIDQPRTEHGVDVVALTARRGLGRYQLTDKWRNGRTRTLLAVALPLHHKRTRSSGDQRGITVNAVGREKAAPMPFTQVSAGTSRE